MVKRARSREELENDDYLKDDNEDELRWGISDRYVDDIIYERHADIKNCDAETVSRWLPRAYLFDLPGYAAHENPQVAKQLGAMFDLNDWYNISCQVWDYDIFSADDYIGTAKYGEGLCGPTEFHAGTSLFTMAAALNSNPECLKEMIRAGADVESKYNQSALHFAVKYNTSEVVQLLIEQGMDVNAKSERFGSKTPAQLALEQGDGKTFEILARAGALFDKEGLKEIVPQNKNFEFVNALSPEMREELGFPKEGLSCEENPAEKTANTSLYLSKFAQASKEGNTPQPTPSKQR